jgi:excisionase family DNA binding protein
VTEDELLTVPAAAQYLGIRPWTLRHWISDRKIDVVKYGNGAVRAKRTVLERFVVTCTIKARASDVRRTPQSRLLKGPSVGPDDESLAR